jgi:hypothetical protein
MNKEFIVLANGIKDCLESRFQKDMLANDYVYQTLLDLISQYNSGRFSAKKTDIGIAAVKLFDSDTEEDNNLIGDISKLAKLYKRG